MRSTTSRSIVRRLKAPPEARRAGAGAAFGRARPPARHVVFLHRQYLRSDDPPDAEARPRPARDELHASCRGKMTSTATSASVMVSIPTDRARHCVRAYLRQTR